MSSAFNSVTLLSLDQYAGQETITLGASDTYTSKSYNITHYDSAYGYFLTFTGTRYATLDTDVQIQIQQATTNSPTTQWSNVGAAVSYGTGGTVGVPAATYLPIGLYPASGETFMPYFRFVITTQAGAGCVISQVHRSIRGMK